MMPAISGRRMVPGQEVKAKPARDRFLASFLERPPTAIFDLRSAPFDYLGGSTMPRPRRSDRRGQALLTGARSEGSDGIGGCRRAAVGAVGSMSARLA
jgi:hypothetical protein